MACSSLTNASRLEFLPELSVEEPEVKLSSARRSIDYIHCMIAQKLVLVLLLVNETLSISVNYDAPLRTKFLSPK